MALVDKDIDGTLELDSKGLLKIYEGSDAIKESLRNLMFNFEDDYILAPENGSITYDFLHESLSEDNAFMLKTIIRNALAKGEPRLKISNIVVNVIMDEIRQQYLIAVSFRYAGSLNVMEETLEI